MTNTRSTLPVVLMKNGRKEEQLQNEKLLSSQRVVFRTILIIFLKNTNALCQKFNRYVI
jgi:hypothetical protein